MRLAAPAAAALALAPALAPATPPWPEPATWRVRVDQVLDTTRWRGAVPVAVDRFDARSRLQVDGHFTPAEPGRPAPRWRVDLTGDLEVAADLAPDGARMEAMPDSRRPALDLYHLTLRVTGPGLRATAGRVLLWDALGLDAVDGAHVAADALPHLTVSAHGGLAVRRAFSSLGPDLFTPDGALLPDRAAGLVGAGLALRDVPGLEARLDWRRQADDEVVREQAALAATWRPHAALWLDAGLRYDLVFLTDAEAWAGAGLAWGPTGRVEAGWRRRRPLFAADTIWNAFGPLASHDVEIRLRDQLGPVALALEAAGRRFDAGDDRASAPALGPGDHRAAAPTDPEHGLDVGAHAAYAFTLNGHPADLGAQARFSAGYGGARHLADVFATVPVPLRPGQGPLEVRPRLGVLHSTDPDRPERDGPAGWGLLAVRWRAAESISLKTLVEGHFSAHTPYRTRAMTHLRFEDWW